MADLNRLLAQLRAADPEGGDYRDQGALSITIPGPLQVEFEGSSTEAQAVAGRWEDGQLVEVIAWHPSGEAWTIESIDCGEDADSYGVPDNGWPSEEEEEADYA